MFKLDMQALREAAHAPQPAACEKPLAKLAGLAALAISPAMDVGALDLLAARLMAAAMRRCDQFNDDDKARQDMREQVLETPPQLRQDLLDHFMCRPPTLH